MSEFTPKRLTELRRIAEAARPGPWFFGNTDPSQRIILGGNTGRYVATVIIHQIPRIMGLLDEEQREANARHIAAFDPTTALELLDALGAARAEAERLREALRFVADAPARTREWMQANDMVFDDITDRWQKAAFSLYTDLVEVAERARSVLDEAGGGGDGPSRQDQEPTA